MNDHHPLVLIVEDESDLADIYATWLEEKYRVRIANSGGEAVKKLDDEIDVILVDRRMPGLCGADVLEEVRERQIDCHVSMVTAMQREFGTIETGIDAYLLKPVSRDTLMKTTEDMLTATSSELPQ